MDWIVGLLLLVCGAVIGFFAAKFSQRASSDKQSGLALEQDIKRLMSEQAAIHISESRQLLATIEQQSLLLKEQLENYESLLTQTSHDPEQPQMNYFGEQAAAYLRNQSQNQRPVSQTTDYQPRDYAKAGTGLFKGTAKSSSSAAE